MYYSYVIGIDKNIYKLESEGFVIEKDNDNYQVSFPEDKAQIWEDGYKRFEVIDLVNGVVLALCEKLCDCKFESIREMLSDNLFYSQVLTL